VFENLLSETTIIQSSGDLKVPVRGISCDSRAIKPGDLFVALRGQKTDGRDYIFPAIAKGAAAIVCEPPAPPTLWCPLALVADARRALADLAAAFYGHPSHRLGLVGVTGTDGKTTTTHLIAAILNAAGVKTGLISTVAFDRGHGIERNPTPNTTPDALVIQRALAEMRDAGFRAVALEVSSHALVTERVRGCVFDAAVFTNLDPEHLDFHGTLVGYRNAKAQLFAQLSQGPAKGWGRLGVVNADDPSSAAMRAACSVPCIDYGLLGRPTMHGQILRQGLDGTVFRVRAPEGEVTFKTVLCGKHNVSNWLGAIGAARHLGASLEDARRAGEEFGGVPGRLEPVRAGQPFHVFVDFAHTPQALSTTLGLLRRHVRGRLIVVFGQAGHRDAGNRSRMAEAVAEHADLAIISNDDPYDDDPDQIASDIARAFRKLGWREGSEFWKILDRREAIHFAISRARRGDCVLLAGRGPEDTTVIGQRRIHLSDAEVAREALTHRRAA
jgi:UDP-N-acetylmuramoyl-L-alanyl-D-glutamate--2,6-diaminopimelate ligase